MNQTTFRSEAARRTLSLLLVSILGGALPGSAGAASLSWDSVVSDTDGGAIGEPAGYRVFSSTASFLRDGVWISTRQAMADAGVLKILSSGASTSAEVDIEEGTTRYFRVTVVASSGMESAFNLDAAGAEAQVSGFAAAALPAPAPEPTPAPAPAPQPAVASVSWTQVVNAAADGGSLLKVGGCDGCLDAGGLSSQELASGDGTFEFTVGQAGAFFLAGLSRDGSGDPISRLEFGLRFNGAGYADVLESGVYKGGDTPYASGDSFRLGIEGGVVRVLKNGAPVYSSAKPPAYPLRLDAVLGGAGASIKNAGVSVSAADPAPASSGPLAAYSFNEASGAAASDASGNENTALLQGAGWTTAGRYGGALSIDGAAGYAEAPASPSPGTQAAFSAWIFAAAPPAELVSLLNKWSQDADDEYLFGLTPDRRLFFSWRTTGGGAYGSSSYRESYGAGQIPVSAWTHVAVVRNAEAVEFFINGELDAGDPAAADAFPFRAGANSLRIGAQARGGKARVFNGLIDEVRVYDRALTRNGIRSDMDSPLGDAVPEAPAAAGPESVDWTRVVNAAALGGSLRKVSGCGGCLDAGGLSGRELASGDGYFEFAVGEAGAFFLAGLSRDGSGDPVSRPDFALRFNGAGYADVLENGVYKGGETPYASGDAFRLGIEDGVVRVRRNGALVYSSAKPPAYPLRLDAVLAGAGASIENAVALGVTAPAGVQAPPAGAPSRVCGEPAPAAYAYPNPAVEREPVIRACLGELDSLELTILDVSGRVVKTETLPGTPNGNQDGEAFHEYPWTGAIASGVYVAVLRGKRPDGGAVRASARFAVIR